MIVSFADRATELLYRTRQAPRRFPHELVAAALRKLDMLDAADALIDLRSPPSNRLELLKGRLAGMHSVRINDQWRLVFRWTDGDAYKVQILDYY